MIKKFPPLLVELTDRIQRLPLNAIFKPGSHKTEVRNLSEILVRCLGQGSALEELTKFEEKYLPPVKVNSIVAPFVIGTLVYITYFSSVFSPSNTQPIFRDIMTLLFGIYAGFGVPTIIKSYLRVVGSRALRGYIAQHNGVAGGHHNET